MSSSPPSSGLPAATANTFAPQAVVGFVISNTRLYLPTGALFGGVSWSDVPKVPTDMYACAGSATGHRAIIVVDAFDSAYLNEQKDYETDAIYHCHAIKFGWTFVIYPDGEHLYTPPPKGANIPNKDDHKAAKKWTNYTMCTLQWPDSGRECSWLR
ncbi:hypothetical protein RJ55_05553 [Drechmeria coniospora]|nr:hypothetical protein RJ55_05553 [Drechmeria coniospora]